jgi:hypothetical protein
MSDTTNTDATDTPRVHEAPDAAIIQNLEQAISTLQGVLKKEKSKGHYPSEGVPHTALVDAMGGQDRPIEEWDLPGLRYPLVEITLCENETGHVKKVHHTHATLLDGEEEEFNLHKKLIETLNHLAEEFHDVERDGFTVLKIEIVTQAGPF